MNVKMSAGGSITIDGKTFNGKSITIQGNKVIVDGVEQEGSLVGDINVVVNGDAESVKNVHGTITVHGKAGVIENVHGAINCAKGAVGSVESSNGNIHCGDVNGNVSTTHGSVTCGKISGSVKTTFGNINNPR